ncbi:MAG: tRNA lysidine(34) synthetase TilS [Sedimentisphaerales bacterium]|nr:tRNA lysidine(34) synthetase TilS [Sedimentisphaerales bacterium]MBN2843407.1 tRNA lysidine(34) synthetase TilS [Sedimentisphaerales bacterium]
MTNKAEIIRIVRQQTTALCPDTVSQTPETGIVLAISGGTDSMALLDIFCQIAKETKWRLVVGHLNHCLRGKESDQDEMYVLEQSKLRSVKCISKRADITAFARDNGISIESAAREIRYNFLRDICRQENCQFIATGHHADDNIETILQRMIRGTGIKGLAGIKTTRKIYADNKTITIFRPLLQLTRAELENYIRESNITPCHDSTNECCDYTRNRIRNLLIPLLKEEYNSNISQSVCNLGLLAADADEILTQQAVTDIENGNIHLKSGIICAPVEFLGNISSGRARNLLRFCFSQAGIELSAIGFETIETLLQQCTDRTTRKIADLPGNWLAEISDNQLIIAKKTDIDYHQIPLIIPGQTKIHNLVSLADLREIYAIKTELVAARGFDLKTYAKNKPELQEIIDLDKVTGKLYAWPLIAGLKYQPLGMTGSQTSGDIMTNNKVPRYKRNSIAAIYDDLGIIAIAGHRIADRIKIDGNTRQMAILTFLHK